MRAAILAIGSELLGTERLDTNSGDLVPSLRELISRQELGALRQRLEKLLRERTFPKSGYRRPVPWPPV